MGEVKLEPAEVKCGSSTWNRSGTLNSEAKSSSESALGESMPDSLSWSRVISCIAAELY